MVKNRRDSTLLSVPFADWSMRSANACLNCSLTFCIASYTLLASFQLMLVEPNAGGGNLSLASSVMSSLNVNPDGICAIFSRSGQAMRLNNSASSGVPSLRTLSYWGSRLDARSSSVRGSSTFGPISFCRYLSAPCGSKIQFFG